MKILLLDTETNGLPANRFAPISQTDSYPAVLQLSWAMFTIDSDTMVAGPKKDITIALDPAIPWNADAAKIHGLTEEEGRRGLPAAAVFLEFREVLRQVDCVVAHNLSFDKPVIRAAAYAASVGRPAGDAAKLRDVWPKVKELCTMVGTRDLLKIPSAPEAKHPHKLPRLNELYTWLYGHVYDLSGTGLQLHSARTDTHCLSQCMEMLLKKGLLRVQGDGLVL